MTKIIEVDEADFAIPIPVKTRVDSFGKLSARRSIDAHGVGPEPLHAEISGHTTSALQLRKTCLLGCRIEVTQVAEENLVGFPAVRKSCIWRSARGIVDRVG